MRGLADWDEVAAFALSLGGTEPSSHYGRPAIKVSANGRAFVATGNEPATSFVALIDNGTVEQLMATDPDTFWQTPHYVGYDAVLVRFASADGKRVRAIIERARDQAAAKKPARKR